MSKREKPKVSTLPGQRTTPQVALARLIDQADEMEELVAVIHWKDNSVSVALNDMDVASLCVLHKYLGCEIDRILRGES
jgi:hypothetical protein